MIPTLRTISFVLGCLFVVAPSFVLFAMAAMLGEPYEVNQWRLFLPTLALGLVMGGGLLFASLLPYLSGIASNVGRAFVGLLIFLSAISICIFLGFVGSVSKIVSPFVLLFELAVFYLFVFPAKTQPKQYGNG